jgi:hypothetical protein
LTVCREALSFGIFIWMATQFLNNGPSRLKWPPPLNGSGGLPTEPSTVLDYMSAHVVVSTNDQRRMVPFRRRSEKTTFTVTGHPRSSADSEGSSSSFGLEAPQPVDDQSLHLLGRCHDVLM